MAQDFAKQRNNRKTGTRKNARSVTKTTEEVPEDSHWSWFLSGLVSGLFAAFILYLGVVNPEQQATVTTETLPVEAESIANERGDFIFYTSLPAAEVQVDVVPVEDIARSDIPDPTQYMIQAGSFREQADAENHRASVILLNLEANVVPGIVGGRTWYRVRVGPITGRRATESARDILSDNNIDSVISKLR